MEHPAATALWDAWAQGKLTEVCDTLEIALRRIGVAPQPLLARLQPPIETAGQTVNQRLLQSLRQGLARPGTAWQRTLRRGTGAALSLLPVAALLWVSFQVVTGFLHGATGQAAYLGIDFAINSLLLVLVAWLLPYLLHRRLRPSTETTVIRALRTGLELGLEELNGKTEAAFTAASAERGVLFSAEAGSPRGTQPPRRRAPSRPQRDRRPPARGAAVASRYRRTAPHPIGSGPAPHPPAAKNYPSQRPNENTEDRQRTRAAHGLAPDRPDPHADEAYRMTKAVQDGFF